MAEIAITPEVGWAILSLLVGAIAAAAWMFVVAVLRHLGEQERWQWAEGFVRAAEQMLAGQDGQAKREWVIAQLTAASPSSTPPRSAPCWRMPSAG